MLPFLLSFALLVPILTTITFFYNQKYSIRKEVKQLLITFDKSKLTSLKFSKTDALKLLDWEHDEEFEYNNEMYDVVETNVSKDSILYLCWHDHEETQLNRSLNELVSKALNRNTDSQDRKQKLEQFYKSLICQDIQLLWVFKSKHLYLKIVYNYSIITNTCSSSSPPPEYS